MGGAFIINSWNVSKILGHASVRQAEVYARVMNIESDKAMEMFTPR
jgi:hypothetical protein